MTHEMDDVSGAMVLVRDGGPARDMTLRDEFAKAALTGLLASGDLQRITVDGCAFDAYRIADAMLAAREVRS